MKQTKLSFSTSPVGTSVVSVTDQVYDIYIGRRIVNTKWNLPESEWHNPYKVDANHDVKQVVEMFEKYLINNETLMNKIPTLKGKVLGCWCKKKSNPNALCHGDILAKYANRLK